MLVASAQKKLLEERLKLISELWDAGIKVWRGDGKVKSCLVHFCPGMDQIFALGGSFREQVGSRLPS